MRKLLLLAAALALTGCVPHTQSTRVQLGEQGRFTIIQIDPLFSYLIDPRTETCVLRQLGGQGTHTVVAVSCEKLKRNVPEAAPHLPWVADAPAATP